MRLANPSASCEYAAMQKRTEKGQWAKKIIKLTAKNQKKLVSGLCGKGFNSTTEITIEIYLNRRRVTDQGTQTKQQVQESLDNFGKCLSVFGWRPCFLLFC